MGFAGEQFVKVLFDPPKPTLRQRVKAFVLNAVAFAAVIFVVTCGSVGFAVLARAFIRWWIG